MLLESTTATLLEVCADILASRDVSAESSDDSSLEIRVSNELSAVEALEISEAFSAETAASAAAALTFKELTADVAASSS